MKHLKKIIAVILTAVLMSSLLLPVVVSAAGNVPGDHTTFEEFWEQMTDEEGNIDWKKLPKVLFKAFLWIRIFEAIGEFFRNIFGIEKPVEPEVTTEPVAEVVTTTEAVAA